MTVVSKVMKSLRAPSLTPGQSKAKL